MSAKYRLLTRKFRRLLPGGDVQRFAAGDVIEPTEAELAGFGDQMEAVKEKKDLTQSRKDAKGKEDLTQSRKDAKGEEDLTQSRGDAEEKEKPAEPAASEVIAESMETTPEIPDPEAPAVNMDGEKAE